MFKRIIITVATAVVLAGGGTAASAASHGLQTGTVQLTLHHRGGLPGKMKSGQIYGTIVIDGSSHSVSGEAEVIDWRNGDELLVTITSPDSGGYWSLAGVVFNPNEHKGIYMLGGTVKGCQLVSTGTWEADGGFADVFSGELAEAC